MTQLRTSGEGVVGDVVPGECFVPLEGGLTGSKIFLNPENVLPKTWKSAGIAWSHDPAPNYTWARNNSRIKIRFIPRWDAGPETQKQLSKSTDRFPHTCSRCKAPAYIGFMNTECSKGCQ